MIERILSKAELISLKRWNTPTIYNGWEQITSHDSSKDGFNLEESRDFMPQMGPMVGYAVTVVIEPSNRKHKGKLDAWSDFRRYVAGESGPKILVVQDLDKPAVIGSFWGEVTSNTFRALGCVGTITDGGIRDLDEMTAAGFKAIARRLCVGHAHVAPIRWDCKVDVFGTTIMPGQLVHADQHGFLAIPPGEEIGLLDASLFMDDNEVRNVIKAARDTAGKSMVEILDAMDCAVEAFTKTTFERFGKKGEWE
jgi:regulator of RNase E activity RraA